MLVEKLNNIQGLSPLFADQQKTLCRFVLYQTWNIR